MTIASHHNIMWSQSTDVTDGQTDRRYTVAIPRYNTVYVVCAVIKVISLLPKPS